MRKTFRITRNLFMMETKKIHHTFFKRYSFRKYSKEILQYCSDLHLEYRDTYPKIEIAGKYLALLGDIGSPLKKNYSNFLKYCSDNFETVYLLSGNHEYHNSSKVSMETIDNKIEKIVSTLPNIKFMNNTSCNLYTPFNKYKIISTTLWSKIYKSHDLVKKDNTHIFNKGIKLNSALYNELHDKSTSFIQKEIKKCIKTGQKAILFTHHLPSFDMIDEKYREKSKYSDRYASDLNYLIKDPIVVILSGHSHQVTEKTKYLFI